VGLFGKKAQTLDYDHKKARLARNLDEAEIRHLEVLRREIANLIVESDPELMMRCYEKAWAFEREITANLERAVAEEAALVAKFPMFSEFEMLGTRHFVPYHEARDMWSDDALAERYHEISRMLVFMRRRQEFSANVPVHDAREREVLYDCMQREKDRRFRERIEDAIRRLYAYRAGLEKGDPTTFGVTSFEDAEVEVIHLPSLSDNEYGIAFKKTGEFGVYGFHVFDSGKIMRSYYRSDAAFNERKSLAR
jgi:hypothetical protein